MIITVTAEQLATHPELMQFAIQAMALGVHPTANGDGSSSYYLDSTGEKILAHDQLQMILDCGCSIYDATLYSPVIPRTTLDNKVPSDWDGALNDEGKTKEWQEYCHTYDYGADQCALLYKGPMDENRNCIAPTTDAQLRAWIAKFGGFMTAGEFSKWKETNEPEVV